MSDYTRFGDAIYLIAVTTWLCAELGWKCLPGLIALAVIGTAANLVSKQKKRI